LKGIRFAARIAVCTGLLLSAPAGRAMAGPFSPSDGPPSPRIPQAGGFRFPLPAWHRSGFDFGDDWLGGDLCGGRRKAHTGIDVRAFSREGVMAAADGMIVAWMPSDEWGHVALIEHSVPGEGTVITQYWHVEPRSGYPVGTLVRGGEVFARVANLGGNTHLHFAVHAGRLDTYTWRGALPRISCGGDPAFPEHFVDPTRFVRAHGRLEGEALLGQLHALDHVLQLRVRHLP
jgi:murein DD-endopeptidase MepM/ murein hydrolase activator NlpD